MEKRSLRLKNWLKKRVSFRFHMSLIVMSTVLIGFLGNFLLLQSGMSYAPFRYPLGVMISYGAFLFFIRFYLRSIIDRYQTSVLDYVDVPDVLPVSSGPGSPAPLEWSGDGGQFSGGGASGSFGEGAASGTSSSGSLDVPDIDEGTIIVVAVGAALMVLIFGTGVYFVWHAPEILSECLIQVLLVSGMRRQLRKIPEAEWLTHIFKSTWKPAVAILFVSFFLGLSLVSFCPGARTLRDYQRVCWPKNS